MLLPEAGHAHKKTRTVMVEQHRTLPVGKALLQGGFEACLVREVVRFARHLLVQKEGSLRQRQQPGSLRRCISGGIQRRQRQLRRRGR